jgi:Uma2 family endonuclease
MAIVEAVKPVTADELFRLPRSERYELVKGALVKMSPPPGYEHGRIIMRLALRIGNHVAAATRTRCARQTWRL